MISIKVASMMFLEPAKAFTTVENSRSRIFLTPLLATLVGSALLLAWYYHSVNFPWLQDTLTASADAAQREALKKVLTPTMLSITGAIGLCVTIPALNALIALYLFLVAKVQGSEHSFGKWFGLVVWSSLPGLLLIPVGAITILLNQNGQIAPEQLNPTSLNQLIFHLPKGSAWKAFLDNVSLISVWTAGLMVVGVRAWTSMSTLKSILIVAAPNVLFFGAWAMIIVASQAA